MNRSKRTALAGIVIVAITLAAHGFPRGPFYNGLRSMGMGNTTVAVTTDRTAIFHNPAGLSLITDRIDLAVSPMVFSIDGNLFEMLEESARHSSVFADVGKELNPDVVDAIYALEKDWVGMQYLPEITVAKKNLGFGIYSTWPVGLRFESGHFIPKIGIRGQQDLVFTWAVGVPLQTEDTHFGISVEYLQRRPVLETITPFHKTFVYYEHLEDNPASALDFLGDFSKIKHGTSFDIGFMHEVSGFRLASAVKDIFGVVGGEVVFPPQLDLGAAYYFPQLEPIEPIRGAVVSFELTDVAGFETRTGKFMHMGKKVHLGGEIDLKYVQLRAGLNQGYPTAGVGISGGLVQFDYVFFTEELGYYPGQQPRKMHVVSANIGLRLPEPRSTSLPSATPVAEEAAQQPPTPENESAPIPEAGGEDSWGEEY
jgi:hypothetical protein